MESDYVDKIVKERISRYSHTFFPANQANWVASAWATYINCFQTLNQQRDMFWKPFEKREKDSL